MDPSVIQPSRFTPSTIPTGGITSSWVRRLACRARQDEFRNFDSTTSNNVCKGCLILPGGELWWLGLGGTHDALVPVTGSNELTVYGAVAPTTQLQANPDETSIVLAKSSIEEIGAKKKADRGYHRRRTARVSFTCNLCMTRNEERPVNPAAYRSGSVFARCTGCGNTHKLVDNLNIFDETYEVFPPPGLRGHFLEKELLERIRLMRDDER